MGGGNLFVFLLISVIIVSFFLRVSVCMYAFDGLAVAKRFGWLGAGVTLHMVDTERLPYCHPSLPPHCLQYSQTPYLNALLFFPRALCCGSSTLSKQQGIIGQRLPTWSGTTISPNTRTPHESCSLSSEYRALPVAVCLIPGSINLLLSRCRHNRKSIMSSWSIQEDLGSILR